MTEIQKTLFKLCDLRYKSFVSKLIPGVDAGTIIGVRMPELRKLARSITDKEFMLQLPHTYYEENNLHGFVISDIRDYDACIEEINRFLPFVDNWATCDSLRPKCFAQNREKLISEVKEWISAHHDYTIRFGIEMLMVHFLGDDFCPEYHSLVASVRSDEYYVNMMIAWYFATALAIRWDNTLPYILNHCLCPWVEGKTIQKTLESNRISDEQKHFLRKLKRS